MYGYSHKYEKIKEDVPTFIINKVQTKPTTTEIRMNPTKLPPLAFSKSCFDGLKSSLSDAIVRLRTPEKRNRSPRKVKILLPNTLQTEMLLPPQKEEELAVSNRYMPRCTTPIHFDSFRHQRHAKRLEKHVTESLHANERVQFPLSTVIVRWTHSPRQQPFCLDYIWYQMSRFGYITHLQYKSPTSATVVFDNLISACNAVTTKYVYTSQNRLCCHWYHAAMKNKTFQGTGSRFKVLTNAYIRDK